MIIFPSEICMRRANTAWALLTCAQAGAILGRECVSSTAPPIVVWICLIGWLCIGMLSPLISPLELFPLISLSLSLSPLSQTICHCVAQTVITLHMLPRLALNLRYFYLKLWVLVWQACTLYLAPECLLHEKMSLCNWVDFFFGQESRTLLI